MSTNGMTSWAVDLKNVGAIYPFQGYEVAMVIIGLAFWVIWHILQMREENREIREKMRNINTEAAKKAIDRY